MNIYAGRFRVYDMKIVRFHGNLLNCGAYGRGQGNRSESHASYAVHFAARPQLCGWVQFGVRNQPAGSSLISGFYKSPISVTASALPPPYMFCNSIDKWKATLNSITRIFHAAGWPSFGHEGLIGTVP